MTVIASGSRDEARTHGGAAARCPSRELIPVGALMTLGATLAPLAEEQGPRRWPRGPQRRGLGTVVEVPVTLGTGHCGMGSGQRETEPFVGLDRDRRRPKAAGIVAGAAALPIGQARLPREPALMGVGMTIRTAPAPEGQQNARGPPVSLLEGSRRVRSGGRVTPATGDLRVLALERKPQLRVLLDGETAGFETPDVVARRAGPTVGAIGELVPVGIAMTIAAGRGLRAKEDAGAPPRLLPRRTLQLRMTGPARHALVLTLQWIRRLLVLLEGKQSRREAPLIVTGRAVKTPKPGAGGTAVGVRVTGRTLVEGGAGLVHPGTRVTGGAVDRTVFSEQRIACRRVIESLAIDLSETPRHMTTGALRAEAAAMNILVTAAALLVGKRLEERDRPALPVPRRFQPGGQVTLPTLEARVLTLQGKVGLGVGKGWRRFPGLLVVARQTDLTERAAMGVLMAAPAGTIETQPALFAITPGPEGKKLRGLPPRLMALTAFDLSVLAGQGPAGAVVVEEFGGSTLPFDELKVPAGVFRMARRAVLGPGSAVQPPLAFPKHADGLVAFETLLVGRARVTGMTAKALSGTFQLLVGCRQRTWRDLRQERTGPQGHNRGRADKTNPVGVVTHRLPRWIRGSARPS